MTPEYITVHNTANDASATNEISYMIRNNNQVSFHVAIDDKEVIQAIPYNRNAWHCGDGGNGTGNRKSIGIEICYSKSGGKRYIEAEENAVQYIASLLNEFGWGIDRVRKHQDWSGKYCPHRILSEHRWDAFLKRIEVAMNCSKKYRIKSGTFKNESSANAAKQALDKHNIANAKYTQVYKDGELYRFLTGTYESKLAAEEAVKRMKSLNIVSCAYVIDA